MTRTENERELVLGNKQLLSAFFVVVALLGVFFTAGYIIGRNTGAKSGSNDASASASPATEAAQRTVNRGAEPAPKSVAPQETAAAPTETAPVQTAPVTEPEPKPAVRKPAAETVPEQVGAVAAQVVPGHQYLQLMAVKRPVADDMVKLLKGRGYPALLGESSKPELFRVLVGPFTDMATLAKTKAGLKAAGFESVIAK